MARVVALSPTRAHRWLAAYPLALSSGLAVAWFFVLAAMAVVRYQTFDAGLRDLDIQNQVIWNTAHGRPFASTVLKENDIHLAEHLAFSLTPFALLYALWPEPRVLLVVQALALTLTSLAVYLYARARLGDPLQPLVVQLSVLAMPLMANIALDDFHPVALAALPLAFGGYLALTGRTRPALALLALAALAEEEAALAIAGLGLLLALRGQRRLGLATSAAAASYVLAAALLVMPAFQHSGPRPGGPNRTLAHFSQVRSDPSALLVLARPERLWDAWRWLLLPSGNVALASPTSLLPAAPTFAALFFQDELLEKRYQEHWAAVMLPFLGFAAADGVRRLSRARGARPLALTLVLAATVVAYIDESPLPASSAFDEEVFEFSDHDADIARALPLVPPDIPIQASGTLVAYLNQRPEIYVYPPSKHYAEGLWPEAEQVDFVVLDLFDRTTQRAMGLRGLSPLRREPPPVLFAPAHKVLFVSSRYAPPSYPAPEPALFGEHFRLEGYDVERHPDRLVLTLHWLVEQRTYFTYNRRLELVDEQGRVVAAEGAMPLLNIATTDDWRAGQRVIDRVEFAPPDIPQPLPQRLRFRVSWKMTRAVKGPLSQLALASGARFYESPLLP